jgi:hypothetical protein
VYCPSGTTRSVLIATPETAEVIVGQPLSGTITLHSALPDLSNASGSTEIDGPGASVLTVARSGDPGTPGFRIFTVDAGAQVTLDGLTITAGRALNGGGISNSGGTLMIEACSIVGNADSGYGQPSSGGGVYNHGTLAINASTISGNSASRGGGIYNDGMLTVSDSTISDNHTFAPWSTNGGGIDNVGEVQMASCVVVANAATYGGGIENENSGKLPAESCTIANNTAEFTGGGIANNGGGTASLVSCTIAGNIAYGFEGGGIATGFFGGGTMAVESTTIVGNSAYKGGGIYNRGPLSLINSTIARNSASSFGGGITNDGAPLTAINDTIAYNTLSSSYGGGAGLDAYSDTATLYNCIVTWNMSAGRPDDISFYGGGSVSPSSASNLIGVGISGGLIDGNKGNRVGTASSPIDPMLGPLQDNGGPTMTMALLPRSPAIDAGIAVDGVTTDQRGISRTAYGPPDIGAFELAPLMVSPMVVNGGAEQRSNVTTLAVTFNQWTNLPALIDQGAIGSAVQLVGTGPVTLDAWRFHYDRDSFTLTIDLRRDKDSPQTMLEDGKYELQIDTGQVFALNNLTNPLVDSDGTLDGLVVAKFHQLVGDFNGDGQVTLADRDNFLQHYGTKLGQGLYDYSYDLNGDGIVNLLDYMAWVKRLGYTI